MTEPINDPAYWRQRLKSATELHHSIYCCPKERWRQITEMHVRALKKWIKPEDRVLDAGCGYGRLLTLLPKRWKGHYVGIDLSPDFIELARQTYPTRQFIVGDLRELPTEWQYDCFDWAIVISIRPMVRRNLGESEWGKMDDQLRRVANNLLFLEYEEQLAEEVVHLERL